MTVLSETDQAFMRLALRLARRGYGQTSPNPMVGAVLVRAGKIIGQGWHHRAGKPHAEIEALRNAAARALKDRSSRARKGSTTLYVTLEPCSTHGRTPPCTAAIRAAGIDRVVVGATDPNPRHAGRGLELLTAAGIDVAAGVLEAEATQLNEAFNHWIVRGTPFVTVKAAMSLDGKIATSTGDSKWITGPLARLYAMRMRRGHDAILVGVKTIQADDPQLNRRGPVGRRARPDALAPQLRRVILDTQARTPLTARVVSDAMAAQTTIVVTGAAPERRVQQLSSRVAVWVAPASAAGIDLAWVLQKLGKENVTSLLVEGGGTVNASFLFSGLAQRLAFFYAPKIIGGTSAIKGVGGLGVCSLAESLRLDDVQWRRLGMDLLLSARVRPVTGRPKRK